MKQIITQKTVWLLPVLTAAFLLLAVGCSEKKRGFVHKAYVKQSVVELFAAADAKEWDKVAAHFADQTELDYSSFTGAAASMQSGQEIAAAWAGFLPKFDQVHHQLGNFQVSLLPKRRAKLSCYGTASHYLKNRSGKNVWTVVGSYDFEFKKEKEGWKITRMKFNFKYQDGNLELPKLAAAK